MEMKKDDEKVYRLAEKNGTPVEWATGWYTLLAHSN